MKNILQLVFGIIFISTIAFSAKVGNLFDVSINDEDTIEVKSNLMTYYFANIVSPDGTISSSPILIDRNDKKVEVDIGDVKLGWEGMLPNLSYTEPKQIFSFEQQSTDIEYPINYYSDWKNSVLQFQGANLRNFWDESFTKDNTRAISLLLLNLSVFPELVADSVASDWKVTQKSKTFINKILDLSDKLSKYQSYANEINFYYTMVDESFNLTGSIIKAYTDEGVPIPESLSETEAYWKYIKTLIENTVGNINALNVDTKIQKEIQDYTLLEMSSVIDDYNKATENHIDINDKSIDGYIKAVAKVSSGVKDDDSKTGEILDVLFAGVQRGLVAYQKGILSKMPKNTVEQREEYIAKANRIRYAKLSIATLAFTNKVIFTDDLKEDDSFLLKFLSEVGGEVWGLIVDTYVNDPMEFISKYSNSVSDKYFSSAQKNAAKIGRGFQIGNAIGNKLLPFLFDFGWEDNLASISINNGQLSMLGSLEQRIKIYALDYKNDGDSGTIEEKLIFDSTNLKDGYEYDFYSNSINTLMDEMRVEVYAKQKDLFNNPERSPWEISTYIVPKNYFLAHMENAKGEFARMGLCVRKTLFTPYNTDFAYYKFTDESFKSEEKKNFNCADDEAFSSLTTSGTKSMQDYIGQNEMYSDEFRNFRLLEINNIPLVDKHFKFYSGDDPYANGTRSYSSDNNIYLNLIDYDGNLFSTKFLTSSVDININYEHKEDKDVISLSSFELPSGNKVTKYIWSFSDKDGEVETTVPTIEHELLNDSYMVFVTIYTEQGNIIYRSKEVKQTLESDIQVVDNSIALDNYMIDDVIWLSSANSTGVSSWIWEIYNKGTGKVIYVEDEEILKYKFDEIGAYTITLEVSYADGSETSKSSIDIQVHNKLAVPINLLQERLSEIKVKVTWDKVEEAEGYIIYLADHLVEEDGIYSLPDDKQEFNITDASFSSITLNIESDKAYHVAVKSYRRNRFSSLNTIEIKPHQVLLDAPTNLQAFSSTDNNEIQLSWSTVTGATSYSLCYAKESFSDFETCVNVANGTLIEDIATNRQIFNNLDEDNTYYLRVKAHAGEIESEVSEEFEVKTLLLSEDIIDFNNLTKDMIVEFDDGLIDDKYKGRYFMRFHPDGSLIAVRLHLEVEKATEDLHNESDSMIVQAPKGVTRLYGNWEIENDKLMITGDYLTPSEVPLSNGKLTKDMTFVENDNILKIYIAPTMKIVDFAGKTLTFFSTTGKYSYWTFGLNGVLHITNDANEFTTADWELVSGEIKVTSEGKTIDYISDGIFSSDINEALDYLATHYGKLSSLIIDFKDIRENDSSSGSTVKKTGQTKSYNEAGNEVTDGSQKDDGYYQKGATPSYTRDDVKEVVTDNLTGLMWQDDAAAASVIKPWVTQSNYNARDYANTSGDTATTYCEELSLGGYDDWRLPTRKELQSIADYGRYNPAINVAFVNIVSDYYWSSTTYADYSYVAWTVLFYNGLQHSDYSKGYNYYVRCVRAGQ